MQFTLTYAGPVLSSGNNTKRGGHKHELRRAFHQQLRRVWQIFPKLGQVGAPGLVDEWVHYDGIPTLASYRAALFGAYGYKFVPLVTPDDGVFTSLEMLLLRPEVHGTLVQSGDLDGRLKSIMDALRVPQSEDEVSHAGPPAADEVPFFCLLQDDSLISKLTIATDTLLEPVSGGYDVNHARLVISVDIRPFKYTLSMFA
jgi:hypothetical protein